MGWFRLALAGGSGQRQRIGNFQNPDIEQQPDQRSDQQQPDHDAQHSADHLEQQSAQYQHGEDADPYDDGVHGSVRDSQRVPGITSASHQEPSSPCWYVTPLA